MNWEEKQIETKREVRSEGVGRQRGRGKKVHGNKEAGKEWNMREGKEGEGR